ncbi:MAG: DUF389 domain-containing protein [Anaerolineaceae bacterium]
MTLPSSEQIKDEINEPLSPARRRKQRRLAVLHSDDEKNKFLEELIHRFTPSFDFFLFSLISSICGGFALIFDSAPLYILMVLLSPFLAPVSGLSFGLMMGIPRFVLLSGFSLLISGGMMFLSGCLTGWLTQFVPVWGTVQASFHHGFTIPDFLLLVIGATVTMYMIIRNPNQKILVSNVALAYEINIPLLVAGFGLTSHLADFWPEGLTLFAVHLLWAVFAGVIVLLVAKVKPANFVSYAITGLLLILSIGAGYKWLVPSDTNIKPELEMNFDINRMTATPVPTAINGVKSTDVIISEAPTLLYTLTLVPTIHPTATFTQTLTPVPTPFWARINAVDANGANVRSEPSFSSQIIKPLLNGTAVQVLPDTITAEGVDWAHILMDAQTDGWIVRGLLLLATPAPGW